jgi:hypothetical protein
MLFVLPDYRIRIQEITRDEQQVIVRLIGNAALPEARAHCLIESSAGRLELFEPLRDPELTLHLPFPADQLDSFQLFILGSNDGIIDCYEQNPLHHTGRIRWLAGIEQRNQDVIDQINKGEGINLEFKPFVRIARGEKKEIELIRAQLHSRIPAVELFFLALANLVKSKVLKKMFARSVKAVTRWLSLRSMVAKSAQCSTMPPPFNSTYMFV